MINLIDFILHVDKYIALMIQNYGILTYAILFFIIFLETGLVITPFFPGDSLLFVAGAFAAQGLMNIFILFALLALAAILGDTVNYWIGSCLGKQALKSKLIKRKYLEQTQKFYEKHGGKTIIIARFIPIIRTFAPFVAGVGKMKYLRFLAFNIIGGILWTSIFLFAGYYFGTIPLIQENLTIVIFVIIILSILPPIINAIRKSKRTKH